MKKLIGFMAYSLGLTLVLAATWGIYSPHLDASAATRDAQQVEIAEAEAKIAELQDTKTALTAGIDELKATTALTAEILAKRPAFLEQVAAAQDAFSRAEGKVDVTEDQNQLRAAQDALVAATTAEEVDAQIQAVAAIVESVNARIEAYVPPRSANPRSSAGGGSYGGGNGGGSRSGGGSGGGQSGGSAGGGSYDWVEEMRGFYYDAGGRWDFWLDTDGRCSSTACASRSGVMVTPSMEGQSRSWKIYGMRHEVAHMIQFENWHHLWISQEFIDKFGQDIEVLADCMVLARWGGSVYHSCSQDQINWASSLWSGSVPGPTINAGAPPWPGRNG